MQVAHESTMAIHIRPAESIRLWEISSWFHIPNPSSKLSLLKWRPCTWKRLYVNGKEFCNLEAFFVRLPGWTKANCISFWFVHVRAGTIFIIHYRWLWLSVEVMEVRSYIKAGSWDFSSYYSPQHHVCGWKSAFVPSTVRIAVSETVWHSR